MPLSVPPPLPYRLSLCRCAACRANIGRHRYSDEKLEAMGVDPSLGSAMGVFDLTRGVATRKLAPADPAEVQRVSVAMRAALAADPIPTVNATVSSRVKL